MTNSGEIIKMFLNKKFHHLSTAFVATGASLLAVIPIAGSAEQGATEGTVANLTAEAIADITSSGATLKANHLKLLSDGVLLKSQASIFASRTADWSRLGSTMKGLCKKMNWKDLVL